jgi:hypothetical protein
MTAKRCEDSLVVCQFDKTFKKQLKKESIQRTILRLWSFFSETTLLVQ